MMMLRIAMSKVPNVMSYTRQELSQNIHTIPNTHTDAQANNFHSNAADGKSSLELNQ